MNYWDAEGREHTNEGQPCWRGTNIALQFPLLMPMSDGQWLVGVWVPSEYDRTAFTWLHKTCSPLAMAVDLLEHWLDDPEGTLREAFEHNPPTWRDRKAALQPAGPPQALGKTADELGL